MTLSRWLLAPLLLTACTSAPTPAPALPLPDPAQPATYSQSGDFSVFSNQVNPDAPVQTGAAGRFLQLRSPVPRLPNFERLNDCIVQVGRPLAPRASRPGTDAVHVGAQLPFSYDIGASEAITLRGAVTAALVASVTKTVYPGGETPAILYGNERLQPLPLGLTVVIPGAVGGYPAVSTALPDALPARLLEPVDGNLLSLTGNVRWSDATFDASGQVSFAIPVQVERPEDVIVFCNVINDGNFNLSPEIIAKLTALKWTSAQILGTTRNVERIMYQGDTLLIIEHSASVAYPAK